MEETESAGVERREMRWKAGGGEEDGFGQFSGANFAITHASMRITDECRGRCSGRLEQCAEDLKISQRAGEVQARSWRTGISDFCRILDFPIVKQ